MLNLRKKMMLKNFLGFSNLSLIKKDKEMWRSVTFTKAGFRHVKESYFQYFFPNLNIYLHFTRTTTLPEVVFKFLMMLIAPVFHY